MEIVSADQRGESAIREHIALLLRRKWLILGIALALVLAAVGLSLQQDPVYQAKADVLLSNENLAATLTDTSPVPQGQPDRIVATQARLARVAAVAEAVLREVPESNLGLTEFLKTSRVTPERNTDLLQFIVEHRDQEIAARLANEYAVQYTIYRSKLDTAGIERAQRDIQARIADLREAGQAGTSQFERLVDKEQQLGTMEALRTSNASVVQRETGASQTQPRPKRNAVLAFVLGMLLGVVIAFLRDTLDTRVRTADEVAKRLGLTLLARLPEPSRRLRKDNRLVMLTEPTGPQSEAFRVLRMNLDFANVERGARSIVVTSAVESEGKSTTIANLAVTLARSGKRVILVDLDLRRPFIARFFGLTGRPGITNVALGHVSLEEATVSIAVTPSEPRTSGDGNGSGTVAPTILKVLPAGVVPPNPGEFVGSRAIADLVRRLRDSCDILLIDAPPLLRVSDTLTISSRVDAMFLVARLNVLRRPMLTEIRRLLETLPASKLGFCVTGAGEFESYGYGYAPEPEPEQSGRRARFWSRAKVEAS